MFRFETEGQPFGDFIHATRKFAKMPKLLKSGWVWNTHYYEVTRTNAYVPSRYKGRYEETIYLDEEDFLVFKLSNTVDLTSM